MICCVYHCCWLRRVSLALADGTCLYEARDVEVEQLSIYSVRPSSPSRTCTEARRTNYFIEYRIFVSLFRIVVSCFVLACLVVWHSRPLSSLFSYTLEGALAIYHATHIRRLLLRRLKRKPCAVVRIELRTSVCSPGTEHILICVPDSQVTLPAQWERPREDCDCISSSRADQTALAYPGSGFGNLVSGF